jgi:hypothetical protein
LGATLNDTDLKPNPDTSAPYPNPYSPMLGTPETFRGWTVPPTALKDVPNRGDTVMTRGPAANIVFVDVAVA